MVGKAMTLSTMAAEAVMQDDDAGAETLVRLSLTQAEYDLILERRADEANAAALEQWRLMVARTAADYFDYLDKAGMASSFSEFVNQFGYQGPNAILVYEQVKLIRGVLWK